MTFYFRKMDCSHTHPTIAQYMKTWQPIIWRMMSWEKQMLIQLIFPIILILKMKRLISYQKQVCQSREYNTQQFFCRNRYQFFHISLWIIFISNDIHFSLRWWRTNAHNVRNYGNYCNSIANKWRIYNRVHKLALSDRYVHYTIWYLGYFELQVGIYLENKDSVDQEIQWQLAFN